MPSFSNDETFDDAIDLDEIFLISEDTSAGVAGALQLVDTTRDDKITFDKTSQ